MKSPCCCISFSPGTVSRLQRNFIMSGESDCMNVGGLGEHLEENCVGDILSMGESSVTRTIVLASCHHNTTERSRKSCVAVPTRQIRPVRSSVLMDSQLHTHGRSVRPQHCSVCSSLLCALTGLPRYTGIATYQAKRCTVLLRSVSDVSLVDLTADLSPGSSWVHGCLRTHSTASMHAR
jgi:hypothetical protein